MKTIEAPSIECRQTLWMSPDGTHDARCICRGSARLVGPSDCGEALGLLAEHLDNDPDCVYEGDEPCDPENPEQKDGWCLNCRTKWFLANGNVADSHECYYRDLLRRAFPALANDPQSPADVQSSQDIES